MKAHEVKLEIVGPVDIVGGPGEHHEQVRWRCSCGAHGPGRDIVTLARHGADQHLARVTKRGSR